MKYDVIVIGGGPGGYTAAIRASQHGLKTALIEKNELGGTCLNLGCIPTKSLLNAAKLYHNMQYSHLLGITVDELNYDIFDIYAKKDETVEMLVSGIRNLISANKIDYYHDQASFVETHNIKLAKENTTLCADNIIVATGSRPRLLDFSGSKLAGIFTSDDVLKTPLEAKKICILGGGVIGVELADFYAVLGCEVTIIESEKQILSTLDRELSLSMAAYLRQRGVQILSGCLLTSCEEKDGLVVHYRKNDNEETLICEALIIAVGREANTEGLALENAGLVTENAYLQTNEYYQTNQAHIYAIGDVSGAIQLAHVASTQGKNCIEHIVNQTAPTETQLVPYCIYTSMEIAYVGLTESEAKAKSKIASSKKILMNTNGKHLIETSDRAFIKVVIDENKQILGAQLFSRQATELISYFTMAIQLELTLQELLTIIFPHPTISEAVGESWENILDEAIHQAPKQR